MLICPGYHPLPPGLAQGLVGWWPFDGDALDYSGRSFNGVLTTINPAGGIAPGIRGRARGGFNFPSTSSVINVGNDLALSGSTAASWCFWIKFASTANGRIISKWGNSQAEQAFIVESINNNNSIELAVYGGSGSNYQIKNTGSISTSQWHHVACTFVATTSVSIYIDGVSQSVSGTNGAVTSVGAASTNVRFGQEATPQNSFLGSLDDVRFYNRALAPWEVLALYAAGFGSVTDLEMMALIAGSAAAGGATPWRYVNNNRPVLGTGTY